MLIGSMMLQQNFAAPPKGVRNSVRRHGAREQAVAIEKKGRHARNAGLARRLVRRPDFLAGKIANQKIDHSLPRQARLGGTLGSTPCSPISRPSMK